MQLADARRQEQEDKAANTLALAASAAVAAKRAPWVRAIWLALWLGDLDKVRTKETK